MRVRLPIAARLCLPVAATAIIVALAGGSAIGANGPTIFTIAGGPGQGFKGDGRAATSATLNGPAGIVVGLDGSIVVADTIDQRVRRIDPTGRIQTIAGNGRRGSGGDGGSALQASFQDPTALALGADGTIFVADTSNNRVRALHPNGTITTVAGTGEDGFSGDGGPARTAQLSGPEGLAVDSAGDLFVADTGNDRVRVIRPNGVIDTVAGSGRAGFAGDGGKAQAADLNAPAGLAVAGDGSLLIADSANNRVRRVAPGGIITTVAGDGGGGSGGDGGPATSAQVNVPVDVAAAPSGGFFVAEEGGDRVRLVSANGTINRVAGTGAPRYGGDGHSPLTAYLNAPRAVELMPSGYELLVADSDNNRIRYVGVPGGSSLLAIAAPELPLRARLFKRSVTVRGHVLHVLTIRNIAIPLEATKAARVTLRIAVRRGRQVAVVRTRIGAGRSRVHLPPRLRSGRQRLRKAHYVVGVTATTGKAIATTTFALTVK